VDPTGRAPGRGAYVCVDPGCRERALARGALARALGTPVPAALFEAAADAAVRPPHDIDDHEGGS